MDDPGINLEGEAASGARCPVCGSATESRHGLNWCTSCECGWRPPRPSRADQTHKAITTPKAAGRKPVPLA